MPRLRLSLVELAVAAFVACDLILVFGGLLYVDHREQPFRAGARSLIAATHALKSGSVESGSWQPATPALAVRWLRTGTALTPRLISGPGDMASVGTQVVGVDRLRTHGRTVVYYLRTTNGGLLEGTVRLDWRQTQTVRLLWRGHWYAGQSPYRAPRIS